MCIRDRGAIGVKMYPPMGFYPLGNTGKPNSHYPKALAKIFAGAKKPVGDALDAALNDFYAFCKDTVSYTHLDVYKRQS